MKTQRLYEYNKHKNNVADLIKLLKILCQNNRCIEDEKMIFDQNQMFRIDILDFNVKWKSQLTR